MAAPHYVIRGGIEGRERLRVVSRVMRPSTLQLFERAGLPQGACCLDVACGGGDVTLDIARLVGLEGRVIGVDVDDTKLQLARDEAAQLRLPNVEFQNCLIGSGQLAGAFDVAYCRFLLTHLRDPLSALREIRAALKPGGLLMVVDIDFTGYFCYPYTPGQHRYVHLYSETVRRRGGYPDIGPRLPNLLMESGFENVQVNVVQPAGLEGEVKLLAPITLENIADAVIAENVATADEIRSLVGELYEFARNPKTLGAVPRIIESWGTTPKPSKTPNQKRPSRAATVRESVS
jgi:ubiquinone/menaquinone biosynthesis C-methylase UbiE